MEFKNNEAIYIQIANYVIDQILNGTWKTDDKILSVRDLAIELEVNPNTVMRSYEFLQSKEVIYNKRGIGFFIDENAHAKIAKDKRQLFLKEELPSLFKTMDQLGISIDEVKSQYENYKP